MNHSSSLSPSEELAELKEMEALLGRLQVVLEQERQAVSRLDMEAISGLDDDKRQLVAAFENCRMTHAETRDKEGEAGQIRARISVTAGLVRAEVHANSALLGEAVAVISAKLGLNASTQFYDKRARGFGTARYTSFKSV